MHQTKRCHFLETKNLLSNFQYGFSEGRSTEEAISDITNFVIESFNEGYKPLAVILDLSKEFDIVDHPPLYSPSLNELVLEGTF